MAKNEFDEAREKFYLEKLGTKTPLFLALNSVDRGFIYETYRERPKQDIAIVNDWNKIMWLYSYVDFEGCTLATPTDEVKQLFPTVEKVLVYDNLDEPTEKLFALNAPLNSRFEGNVGNTFVFNYDE